MRKSFEEGTKKLPRRSKLWRPEQRRERACSVAQVSRCTDTGNCTWTEDDTKPQLLGGLGEEGDGGSSLQQMVEEEFGKLSSLLGEPQVQYSDTTVQYQW